MLVSTPRSLEEALAALGDGSCRPLAGGTDLMVAVNHGHPMTSDVVSLDRVDEIRGLTLDGDVVRIGGAATWTLIADEPVRSTVPALAQAARTVGSPQIRNAGTIGGNIATASPAGDSLGVLAALDATVEVRSASCTRLMAIPDVIIGPKVTSLEADELIVAVHVPVVRGWQSYAKVGVRNAMVIATVGVATVVNEEARSVSFGLTSVGPTPLRCPDAEVAACEAFWTLDGTPRTPTARDIGHIAELVMEGAQPIDDHRSSVEYRRHSVGVLAARHLRTAARALREQ